MGGSGETGELVALKIGSQDQPVLGTKGDDLRIDWGYLYVATPNDDAGPIRSPPRRREARLRRPASRSQHRSRRAPPADQLAAAIVRRSTRSSRKTLTRWLIVAYDDLYSIEYMNQPAALLATKRTRRRGAARRGRSRSREADRRLP